MNVNILQKEGDLTWQEPVQFRVIIFTNIDHLCLNYRYPL